MLDFLIPFVTIFLAEFGDKTQVSLVLMSACYSQSSPAIKFSIFRGAMAGFLLVDGVAILAGGLVSGIRTIPQTYIKTAAGIFFIVMGISTLKEFFNKKETSEEPEPGNSTALLRSPVGKNIFFASAAAMILAELGDKTQVAAAMFATKFNWFMVFAGTLAALGILSATAIWAGGIVARKINPRILHGAGGVIFILTGLAAIIFNI